MGLLQEAQLSRAAPLQQQQGDGRSSGSKVWAYMGTFKIWRISCPAFVTPSDDDCGRTPLRVQRQQSSFVLLQTLMQPLASSAGTIHLSVTSSCAVEKECLRSAASS